jgi:CheY-like chemotaxis protein
MNSSPKLILLAEDDDNLRYMCLRQLKRLGYAVHYATTGREAVTMSQQFSYDLVLMDIMMPELDGCQAAKEIRALDDERKRPHAPIIAITALRDIDHCAKRGIELDGFLFKPVMLDDLQKAIVKWI